MARKKTQRGLPDRGSPNREAFEMWKRTPATVNACTVNVMVRATSASPGHATLSDEEFFEDLAPFSVP